VFFTGLPGVLFGIAILGGHAGAWNPAIAHVIRQRTPKADNASMPVDASPELPPITVLLKRATEGDRAALDTVFASLYPDLRRVARARLHSQGRADAMNTTMLVHESFMRLVNASGLRIEDRHHFFAYAAKTMRNVIIDAAREHKAERRGGGVEHVPLDDGGPDVPDTSASDELLRVNDALLELETLDPELVQVVEMRYFGGYSEQEIAEMQGVTERTVRRRWDKARAWLYVALGGAGSAPPPAA
jgi:RNA polymerase sigma factor (TIGR02999 family)